MSKHIFRIFLFLAITAVALSSCSSRKSYAQLLADENISTNAFLADQRVIPYEQRDSTFTFECGADAPYYQLDEDGSVFMQVLNPGTPGNRVKDDQLIFFRFMRYSLYNYSDGELGDGQGNSQAIAASDASFRFNNFSSYNSYQWGTGLQMPLVYLPIDCEVNVVIKSQMGLYNEIANVVPYLYNIRYFKSQI